jgi:hypothetical protein
VIQTNLSVDSEKELIEALHGEQVGASSLAQPSSAQQPSSPQPPSSAQPPSS